MNKAMRDALLAKLYEKMANDEKIFFLAADFGSPVLDKIRADYPNRFINVGIAEQNLINVAVGLALEGYKVFAYAIAPFITMRCYEQIRVNISILSSVRDMNITLIGVGAGASYAMSGPTHHCLEDLSIMKTLPNMEVFSCSDYVLAEGFVDRALNTTTAKYARLDAQPLPALQESIQNFNDGFRLLQRGSKACIISTGFMSHKAIKIAKEFDVCIIDLYLLNRFDIKKLKDMISHIDTIITIEEGFENSGGLDGEINYHFKDRRIINMAFDKKYCFEIGDRELIHSINGVGEADLKLVLDGLLKTGKKNE